MRSILHFVYLQVFRKYLEDRIRYLSVWKVL